MVQAKFKCISILMLENDLKNYEFSAVYGQGNESWSKWTPTGNLKMSITNPAAQVFEVGKEYYLDIHAVE